MNELPQWVQTAISSVIAAAITWLASRRLYKSNVASTDANALNTMTDVAGKLAKQLQAVETEVPRWKQQIADQTARAEFCERQIATVKLIQTEAQKIVEGMGRISYLKNPDEEETDLERRFKSIKAAAKRIAELTI